MYDYFGVAIVDAESDDQRMTAQRGNLIMRILLATKLLRVASGI
jgi:hypothetical protein